MLRLEAFLEMQKDNSKKFENGELMYKIIDSCIYYKYIHEGNTDWHVTDSIMIDDGREYNEVIEDKPLWEVIKDGNIYYVPKLGMNLSSWHVFSEDCKRDKYFRDNHLMFRTDKEAIEVVKKMLELFK